MMARVQQRPSIVAGEEGHRLGNWRIGINNGRSRRSASRFSNAHGGDRGPDLHVAGLGYVASNKRERALGQGEKCRIRLAVGRIVDELVQHHAGVAGHVEGRVVTKCNTNATIGCGLNDITEIDGVANLGQARLIAER